jgi:DNA repair exonuclease SbcCD ATPase subunit
VLTLMGECEQNAAKLATSIARQANKNEIVGQALQRQTDDLDAQYRKLIGERDKLIAEIEAGNLTQEDIDRSLHLRDDIVAGIQNPTPETIMRAFAAIDLRVKVIEGDKG